MPSSVALVSWRHEHEQQHRVERLLGVLEHRAPAARRACCPLPRARAHGCGSCARTRSRPARAQIDDDEEHDDRRRGSASRCRSRLSAALGVGCLGSTLPEAAPAARVLGVASSAASSLLGVVVVEQVQHAVHDEQRELVVERCRRAPAPGAAATVGHTTTSPSSDRRLARARPATRARARPRRAGGRRAARSSSIGNASTSVGPVAAEEALVQLGDRRPRRRRSATSRRRAATRSSSSTSCASRTHRRTSTATVATARRRRTPDRAVGHRQRQPSVGAVSSRSYAFDDVLHDAVAHDVAATELDERETVDAVEDVAHRRAARSGRGPRAGRSG